MTTPTAPRTAPLPRGPEPAPDASAPDLAARVRALEDRAAVVQLVHAVFVRTDLRDWAGVRACLADELDVDYTSLTGGEPSRVRADDLVAAWRGVLPGFEATHHMVTNAVVTLDGADGARCVVDGHATHYLPTHTGESLWTTAGRYTLDLVRGAPQDDGGEWRVRRMTYAATWGRGNQGLVALAAGRANEAGAGGEGSARRCDSARECQY